MIALVGGAYVATIAAALAGVLPWTVLLTLLSAGAARSELKAIEQIEPTKLHTAVLRAAQLHLEFGVLLLVGILVAGMLRR